MWLSQSHQRWFCSEKDLLCFFFALVRKGFSIEGNHLPLWPSPHLISSCRGSELHHQVSNELLNPTCPSLLPPSTIAGLKPFFWCVYIPISCILPRVSESRHCICMLRHLSLIYWVCFLLICLLMLRGIWHWNLDTRIWTKSPPRAGHNDSKRSFYAYELTKNIILPFNVSRILRIVTNHDMHNDFPGKKNIYRPCFGAVHTVL